MEKRIGWLSPAAPPEDVIIDASGNEVILTPEELAAIRQNEYIEEVATVGDLVKLGWFGTVDEAEAYLAGLETPQ